MTPLRSPFRSSTGDDVSARVTPGGAYHAPRYRKGDATSANPSHGGELWPFDHYHQGVDLAADAGARVYSLGKGRVIPASAGLGGVVVVVQLDSGYTVVYADLGRALLSPGAAVGESAPVGVVGARGFVHVAIQRPRFAYVNPAGLFPFTDRR